jgi:hypothetical protein
MTKPVSHKIKYLAVLMVLAVASLLIGGACAANQLPVISSLSLSVESEINPGATAQISCTAVDPDEDELTYTWTADGGNISGSGAHIYWVAPETLGTYTINVEVSDGDDIVTDQLTVTVLAPNTPPTIESLATDCPRVKKAGTATITCEASDPDGDELTYSWSAERGNISGEGAIVSWVAPSEFGTHVVTVTVTDGRGGEATDEISFIVCSCGSACD